MRSLLLPAIAGLVVATGCARGARTAAHNQPAPITRPYLELPCTDCDSMPVPRAVADAIEARIADLMERGGDCRAYGDVLEQSYRAGKIRMRPFMWRVGVHLTSGEAHPSGDIALAQEIDSLNVGVRTIGEMTWSAEHEAVHLAFGIASHTPHDEGRVNGQVRACRPDNAPVARATTSKGRS